jgi:hypothetical protein
MNTVMNLRFHKRLEIIVQMSDCQLLNKESATEDALRRKMFRRKIVEIRYKFRVNLM